MSHHQESSLGCRIGLLLDATDTHFRLHASLVAGYRAMTTDERAEQQADAWSEALLLDLESDRW